MIINKHLKPNFGKYKLKALNAAALQSYANKLKIQGYSKSHLTGILNVMQSALNYAVEPLKYINQNPMLIVKYPKIEKKPKEKIILTIDEFKKIINRFSPSRFYIPLMLGFYTGLRISEAFALTWDDIDLKNKTLTVNKQIVKRNFGVDVRKVIETKGKKESKSAWYFSTTKTESSIRTIKFGNTLYQALKKEKIRQMENELKYNEYYTIYVAKKEKDEKNNEITRLIPIPKCINSDRPRINLVCIAENGEYTSTDSFKYCARVIHHELQLPFDYHSLRHTHATLLIESGANIKNVQARLGHADIKTTLQTYAHDTEKMADQSVDIFESIAHI